MVKKLASAVPPWCTAISLETSGKERASFSQFYQWFWRKYSNLPWLGHTCPTTADDIFMGGMTATRVLQKWWYVTLKTKPSKGNSLCPVHNLSLRIFILRFQPPCCEEVQATWRDSLWVLWPTVNTVCRHVGEWPACDFSPQPSSLPAVGPRLCVTETSCPLCLVWISDPQHPRAIIGSYLCFKSQHSE